VSILSNKSYSPTVKCRFWPVCATKHQKFRMVRNRSIQNGPKPLNGGLQLTISCPKTTILTKLGLNAINWKFWNSQSNKNYLKVLCKIHPSSKSPPTKSCTLFGFSCLVSLCGLNALFISPPIDFLKYLLPPLPPPKGTDL